VREIPYMTLILIKIVSKEKTLAIFVHIGIGKVGNCGKSTFLTLTLRFHALVNSGIKIFGFGSEKWISLVGKKLPILFQFLYRGM
jgi:hypothetical protein